MLPFHHFGLAEKWLESSFIHQKVIETLSHAKHLMRRSVKSLLFPKLFCTVKDAREQDSGREKRGGGEAQFPRGDAVPGQCSLRSSWPEGGRGNSPVIEPEFGVMVRNPSGCT